MPALKPLTFRFTAAEVETMDRLQAPTGVRSRADVLRHAIQRLADAVLTTPEPKTILKKKGK